MDGRTELQWLRHAEAVVVAAFACKNAWLPYTNCLKCKWLIMQIILFYRIDVTAMSTFHQSGQKW